MKTVTNTIDWSATVAWIAFMVAIITPTITTICNNIHQRKLKIMEMNHFRRMEHYHKQCELFGNFLESMSVHLHQNCGDIRSYEKYFHELYLYVPPKYWDNLQEVDEAVRSGNKETIKYQYDEITKVLGSLLSEQRKRLTLPSSKTDR